MAGSGRRRMTIWRIRIACWIPKATDRHSEYVILIAFLRQQWLRERASMSHSYVHLAVFKKSSRKMVPTGHPGVRQTDRRQRSSSAEQHYRFGCGSHYVTKCRIIGQIRVFLPFLGQICGSSGRQQRHPPRAAHINVAIVRCTVQLFCIRNIDSSCDSERKG